MNKLLPFLKSKVALIGLILLALFFAQLHIAQWQRKKEINKLISELTKQEEDAIQKNEKLKSSLELLQADGFKERERDDAKKHQRCAECLRVGPRFLEKDETDDTHEDSENRPCGIHNGNIEMIENPEEQEISQVCNRSKWHDDICPLRPDIEEERCAS
jgi:hypothetical protein